MKYLSIILLCSFLIFAQGNSGPAPAGVTSAIEKEIYTSIRLTGIIHPANRTQLASEVSGKVIRILKKPGLGVLAGETIIQLDDTYIKLLTNGAKATMNGAHASWKKSELQYKRAQASFDKLLISQNDFDKFKLDNLTAQAQYESSKTIYQQFVYQLDQTQIKAPFNGVITLQHKSKGDWIRQGDSVITIVSNEMAEVWVEIPEQNFSSDLSGKTIPLRFSHNNIEKTGVIRAMIPDADKDSHTFKVIIDTTADKSFGYGMMVETHLPTSLKKLAILVPKDAVTYLGNNASIWVVGSDNGVIKKSINTGQSIGAWIEVTGEIQKGTKVVTRGNERLFPGTKISPEDVRYVEP